MKIFYFTLLFFISSMEISAQEEVSVLFIGNSFTFMNNMPSMFKAISEAKGKKVFIDSIVEGGKDLNFHASRPITYQKINSKKWDFVILQGHSNELAQPDSKVDKNSLPFAEQIVDSVRENNPCTQLVLYMTWAYKNGNPKWSPISSYDSMQYRIKMQYLRFADLLDAKVSPVGEVWKTIRTNYSGLNLYDPDNQHPSLLGSYISACTHFTTVFGESPLKNNAKIAIDVTTKQIIELNASQIVLNNLNQWRNIPKNNILEAGFDLVINGGEVEIKNRSKNSVWTEWSFGDGSISIENDPKYRYLNKGKYLITQKISNSCKSLVFSREIELEF